MQEIVGATKFHDSDEGWVITNRTFTASARSLAQANNINLIDGHELKDFAALSRAITTAFPKSGFRHKIRPWTARKSILRN